MKTLIIINILILSSLHLLSQGYEIWGAGANSIGELGNNNLIGIDVFSKLTNISDWKLIATKEKHNLGIKFDGTLWAWGFNTNGQLGDGTNISRNKPVQIGSDNDWTDISTGYAHSMALKIDGSLWAWGSNTVGQLGDSSLIDKFVPTKIDSEDDWKQVSCGSYHTAAIKKDNTLWTWGRNNSFQLGDSSSYDSFNPIRITTNKNWYFVSAGNEHTIALRNDGTIWSWGSNLNGQLGLGSSINFNIPTQIGIDNDWKVISSGYEHTAAIKSDGSLWQWGLNGWGQLADGTLVNLESPTKVAGTMDWKDIITGYHNSIGIKNNGTLWISGCNTAGQIGYDTNIVKISTFRNITNINNWKNIAIGNHFVLALRGTLPLISNITTNKVDNEICLSDSIELSANIVLGIPGYNYKWTPAYLLSNSYIANPIAYPKKSTTFKVLITDFQNSIVSNSIYIKVNDKSKIRVNYNDSICKGETFSAIAAGGLSYKWYQDSVSINNIIATSNKLNSSPLVSLKYILETNTTKCTFYDTLQVKVVDKINVEIGIIGSPNICNGDYIKLFIKNKMKGVFYNWEKDGSIYFSDTLIVNNKTDIYKLYGRPSSPYLCEDSSSISIYLTPIKPIIGVVGTYALCQGDSVKLFIKDKQANVDYSWIVNNIIVNADTIIAKAAQKYKLIAKNISLNSCSDSSEIEVTEQVQEQIVINGITNICEGDSSRLELSKSFQGVQFLWNTGETTNSIIINKAGEYWCRAINNNCLIADTVLVSINPKPIVNIIGDTTICKNATAIIILQGTYTSCTWSNGETTPIITIAKAGIYSVEAENEFGCKTTTQIVVKEVSNNIDYSNFQDIDFGKTNLNKTISKELDISSINVSNFKLTTGTDYEASRNGNKLEIIFKALKKGKAVDSLIIEIDKPCQETIAIMLTAESEAKANQIITLKIADIEVLAGDNDIPLPITYTLNDSITLPQTISWTAKLNYKTAIYYPDITADVLSANRNFDIMLSGTTTLTKKEDTLTTIKGKTYIADTTFTKVNFIDFTSNPDLTIVKEDGSIKIVGLCTPNLRSIEFFTPTTMTIKPNPTSGEVDIEFISETNGETILKLFNSAGAEVMTDTKSKSNTTLIFHYDTLNLPNSIYQVQITQSGKLAKIGSLVIEK